MDKELRKIVESLEEQGFQVLKRTSGHLMVRAPDGESQTTLARTGSDHRGRKNALAHLKRMGFRQ